MPLFLPVFKVAEPLKSLCMACGFIWEGSFNHFISSGFHFFEFCESVIHTLFPALRYHKCDAWYIHYCLFVINVRLNGCNKVSLIEGIQECVKTCLDKSHFSVIWGTGEMNRIQLLLDQTSYTLFSPHGWFTAMLIVGIQMYSGTLIMCELVAAS